MNNKIMSLRDYLNDLGIILSFTGPFSQGVIEEIGDALKVYMENKDDTKNDIHRVFSVFIEQTQNIKNYINMYMDEEVRDKVVNSGILIIGKSEDKYLIRSGNLVNKEDISWLKDNLEEILALDEVGLKKLYKKRLLEGLGDEDNNANLGLVDIVRKATDVKYKFEEIDDHFCFFTMNVLV